MTLGDSFPMDFFSNGYAVDVALAVLLVEALALIFWRKRPLANVMTTVIPGACLLLALRAALTGAGVTWVALWLALSLPAHLADLWRRPP